MLILTSECLNVKTDCCEHLKTTVISDSLYLEKYRTFCGGVFGEIIKTYLTDSSNYRVLVGSNDEHQKLRITYEYGILESIRLESKIIVDTLDRKILSKKDLIESKRYDKANERNKPIFGVNDLICFNSKPFTSYKISDDIFIAKDQYNCDTSYVNAIYLTDSVNFKILIGLSYPSWKPNFIARLVDEDIITVYKTDSRIEYDTINEIKIKIDTLYKYDYKVVCDKE